MISPRLLAEWSHDPGCSCSRTSLGCCLRMAGTLWPMSFRDWPRSAMWDATGYYELPTQVPPTSVSGSSSSPGLLPTPSSSQFNDGESLESWEARNKRLRESWSSERHPHGNGNGMGTPLPIAIRQVLREPASHPSPPEPGSLLPTPAARDGKGQDMPGRHGGHSLPHALLKTPTAQLAVNGGSQHPDKRRAGGHGPTLADQVEHQLASHPSPAASAATTPRATDGTHGGPNQRDSAGNPGLTAIANLLPTPQAADARRGSESQMGGLRPSGAKRSDGLATAAALLPTPTARLGDETSRGADPARYKGPQSLNGRRSNLDDCIAAVETQAPWLSPGEPTGQPLQDGSPSSEGQHQTQLSLDGLE